MSMIARVIRASAEGHDERRLQVEMDRLITSLSTSLRPAPHTMPYRLRELIATGQKLKSMDVDNLIDVFRSAAKARPDIDIDTDLVALEFVSARLGSVLMGMRIGSRIAEELRNRHALRAERLP